MSTIVDATEATKPRVLVEAYSVLTEQAVFTLPAMFSRLRRMFTAVLAIPLADDLPTPNARKTWALAVWLIRTQRLSTPVLTPAADCIALVLCRGIDGDLGKEGKKGSISDGLKAILDLSVHLPAVFIPVFTHSLSPPFSYLSLPPLLPSARSSPML